MSDFKKYTISRFDWERTIRRIVMPSDLRSTKLVALMLATYADADGSSIYPGTERLADVCQLGRSTVHNGLKWLRENWLIHRHEHGGNKGGRKLADVYQLCRPSDWEERFTLLAENGKDIDRSIPRPRRANNPNPLGTRRFDIDTDRQAMRQRLDSR
ncbi:helix-turn-helix domain-containing protein [Paractinoplanes toevensis]|uniref:Helix-turn-helix domain-containing protein n=1 Tax=Paractinoplanes toevensis TaxID=571911 RepID=A0A919W364_9ACTN|nr:helix-turn-helix domain-containing protein [Actinoplanes toevensis]GIM88788.1 hypothetical protein Ato02nite_005810 [Actinoplanes toevensis]